LQTTPLLNVGDLQYRRYTSASKLQCCLSVCAIVVIRLQTKVKGVIACKVMAHLSLGLHFVDQQKQQSALPLRLTLISSVHYAYYHVRSSAVTFI